MREALNLNNLDALFTLLPYDHRINWLGKIFNIRPEPYIFFLDHEDLPFNANSNKYSMANA
ncbi:MAG: hypothetical protein GY751_18940 [Bacteroidetes bacterium]|nr:hypothetical protein [Bacteroidota bacterium]